MKHFFRNFKRQKTIGVLSICGLSLGIMVSVIVGLWGINEFSFDNFHENGENIYRTNSTFLLNGEPVKVGSTFKPLVKEASDAIPEIEDICRIVIQSGAEIKIQNKLYFGNNFFLTDINFFTYFDFPLAEGNPETVLAEPATLVVSKSFAQRFFPEEEVIGRSIRFDGKDFTISGVMFDIPANSHLQADFVTSFYGYFEECTWGWTDSFISYLTLQKGADIDKIEAKLTSIYDVHMGKYGDVSITLEPLKDIHFGTGFLNDSVLKRDKLPVLSFLLVAFVILLISCINFANLFVSASFLRSKTIGVKKMCGAFKGRLMWDFYRETACYVFLSILIGLFLSHLMVSVFNELMDAKVTINFLSPHLYIFLFILFLFAVLMSGSMPAFYMTKFNVFETLQIQFRGKRISVYQKILVIIQFSASITLLIVVFFFSKQINLMLSSDLGFNKENVLHVYARDGFGKNFENFRDKIMKEPTVKDVTMSKSLMTDWIQGWGVRTLDTEKSVTMELCQVKPNYFEFFDIYIQEGKNPFYGVEADSFKVCLLNETAVNTLGLKDPIDAVLVMNDRDHVAIRGVMRDARIRSFHKPVDPQVYYKLTDDSGGMIYFKIAGNPAKAIAFIEKNWKEQVFDAPFEFEFMDNTYQKLYKNEINAEKLLICAMSISFAITIIGFFAIAYYSLQRRVKEIGIRKINGAVLSDLLVLLNRDFAFWVFVSFVIACFVSYFLVKSWLEAFMIKTTLDIRIFVVAGLISIFMALLTISYLTWKAATANPVKSIKNE